VSVCDSEDGRRPFEEGEDECPVITNEIGNEVNMEVVMGRERGAYAFDVKIVRSNEKNGTVADWADEEPQLRELYSLPQSEHCMFVDRR